MSARKKRAEAAPVIGEAACQPAVGGGDPQVVPDSVPATPAPVISAACEQGTLPAPARQVMESTYELPVIFDATTVAAVHAALKALEGRVHLDGSKVEVVDTAAVQLLAALALKGAAVKLKASAVLADLLSVTAVGVVLSLEQ